MTAYLLTDKGRIPVRGAVRADAVPGEVYRAVVAERDAADQRCAELEAEIARLRHEMTRLGMPDYPRSATA